MDMESSPISKNIPRRPAIAITGSNGFIGSFAVDYFLRIGWRVLCLQRRSPEPDLSARGAEYHEFALPETVPEEGIREADIVLHAAYQPHERKSPDSMEINRRGTVKLLEACRRYNVFFIYLSSLSAHSGALSRYGKSKLEIESLLDQSRDLILRPGLVIGAGGGLFSNICRFVEKSRIIPLVGGGRQPVQTLHINDLLQAVHKGIEDRISGLYKIAEPAPMTMRGLYQTIIQALHVKRTLLPLPVALAELATWAAEKLRIQIPISRENVLGLKAMRAFDTAPDLLRFDLKITPVVESVRQAMENDGIPDDPPG